MPQGLVSRRRFNQAVWLGAAMLVAPALQAAEARPEKTRIVLAVGGKASFHHLPLILAEQLGFFRAEGLEVELQDFPGSARAMQAVAYGAADMAAGFYEDLMALHPQDSPLQAFVLQGRTPQVVFGVSTRTLGHYRSLQDLRGRRIGVSAPGSTTSLTASLVLAKAGVKPGELNFVGVGGPPGALTAVRAGQVDAISHMDPVMTLLEQKGEVRVVADTRSLRGSAELFGGPMPSACLCAAPEFIQKHPATVQAMSHAVVHALKWLQTAGPSDLNKTVPEAYFWGDRGMYLAAFEKVRESMALDGLFPEEGGRTVLRALSSVDPAWRTDRIDLQKTYTNQFAQRSKQRFKA